MDVDSADEILISEHRLIARRMIAEAAPDAVRVLRELAESAIDDRVRLGAAMYLADRELSDRMDRDMSESEAE